MDTRRNHGDMLVMMMMMMMTMMVMKVKATMMMMKMMAIKMIVTVCKQSGLGACQYKCTVLSEVVRLPQ